MVPIPARPGSLKLRSTTAWLARRTRSTGDPDPVDSVLDREPRGDLAAYRPSHPVRHHEHDRDRRRAPDASGAKRVFVVGADPPRVGGRCPLIVHLTSMTVLPTCKASPLRRAVGVVIRLPLT